MKFMPINPAEKDNYNLPIDQNIGAISDLEASGSNRG